MNGYYPASSFWLCLIDAALRRNVALGKKYISFTTQELPLGRTKKRLEPREVRSRTILVMLQQFLTIIKKTSAA